MYDYTGKPCCDTETARCRCKFFYRNLQRHRAVLPATARLLFLACNITKKHDIYDHSFAHLTLILLLHYLVKCRSRSFDVYNNEFILGTACRLRKSLWDQKNHGKSVTYLTLIRSKSIIPRSWISSRWTETTHQQQWASLSHTVIECDNVQRHQRLRACVRAGADILSIYCNKDDVIWHVYIFFWKTITASYVIVCCYSVNHSNVHLIIVLTSQSDTSNFPR